jgi:hypothetical protein
MTSSNIEREDIDDASSRAWRKTLDRTRGERQQRGEQYQPQHRREQDDGELPVTGTTTHRRTESPPPSVKWEFPFVYGALRAAVGPIVPWLSR